MEKKSNLNPDNLWNDFQRKTKRENIHKKPIVPNRGNKKKFQNVILSPIYHSDKLYTWATFTHSHIKISNLKW